MALRLLLLALALVVVAACDQTEPEADPLACTVTGAPGLTYTDDDGATLAPNAETLPQPTFTFGLAALTDGTLLASVNDRVYRSTDAGCTWTAGGRTGESVRLTAAGSVAYGWYENASTLFRIGSTGVVATNPLPPGGDGQPTEGIVGLVADGDRVRVGTREGRLFDSSDGGQTWTASGQPAPLPSQTTGRLVYHVAFDPTDRDVVLLAQAVLPNGAASLWRTENAGQTWAPAGTVPGETGTTLFYLSAFAPASSNVVWAFGKVLDVQSSPPNSLYRSTDGGRTFEAVFTAPDDLSTIIQNDPVHLALDSSVLYWAYWDPRAGYADLYRYDHSTQAVTGERTFGQRGYRSLLASPTDRDVLYIGLESFSFDLTGAPSR